jgi:hypothetical protein
VIDWLLRDRRTGKWVVVQVPNVLLLVWLATAVPRWVWHLDGRTGDVLTVLGTTALVVWAADEVARGVNPFRRLLGAVVLVGIVLQWVSN